MCVPVHQQIREKEGMMQVSQCHDMSASHSVAALTIPCLRHCRIAVTDSAVLIMAVQQALLWSVCSCIPYSQEVLPECLLQNLALAVTGFKAMLEEHSTQPGVADSILVIAGGYDRRLAENREHFEELMDLVAKFQLQGKVCEHGLQCCRDRSSALCYGLFKKLPWKHCCVYCTAMRIGVRVAVL